jgi:predicted Rossmann fold nucleotide-binding protein DprA/Smf involved in DNA uptake
MEKMTNVKAIEYVVTNFENELPAEVFEKLNAIKASFVKKSENRGATKTQKENEEIKAKIVALLTEEPVSATEVMNRYNATAEAVLSLPKVTALLTALNKAGEVVRTVDKKKALFSVA